MSRPHRIPNFDYTGVQRYFLTICTANRATHFTDVEVVKLVLDQFVRMATQESMATLAYCFMPDHVHLLVDGANEAADLERFVKLAKQRGGFAFKQTHRKALWQEGYDDRVLRDAERTENVIVYIVSNPIRAGLVKNPADYPHWGSTVHTREEILEFVGNASHAWRRRL